MSRRNSVPVVDPVQEAASPARYGIRILERSDGEPTEFDNHFVVSYDPTFHPAGEEYDGGLLEVSSNPAEAKTFESVDALFEYYRQSFGTRVDGEPNRPLTAFTVAVERISQGSQIGDRKQKA